MSVRHAIGWALTVLLVAELPSGAAAGTELECLLARARLSGARIQTRLENNEFNTSRGLFASSPLDPATSHQDNLGPGFVSRLRALPAGASILSSGCGSAKIFYDLWTSDGFPKPGEMVGLLYSRKNVDPTYFKFLARAAAGHFRLVEGDAESKRFPDAYFDEIEDDNGWFAYTRDPKGTVEKFGRWLKPGGHVDTVYDTHMLITTEQGIRRIAPGFEVVDPQGRVVTREWFASIRGLRLLDERGLERESPWPGKPYQDIRQRARNILSSQPVKAGDIHIYEQDGMEFIHTGREQINYSAPITLERTGGPVEAPPLEELEYSDGRPPIRRYRWVR